MSNQNSSREYRSLFWPILLIGLGALWLLHNLGIIEQFNIGFLLRLWPVLLIVIGLDLLLGRRSPLLGGLIGLLAAGFITFTLLLAPQFSFLSNGEVVQQRFNTSAAGVQAAQIDLDMSIGQTRVYALEQNTNLIDADLTTIGEVNFEVRGEREKDISLKQTGQNINLLEFADNAQNLKWDIGLNPNIPLDLSLQTSFGSNDIDLSQLNLSALDIRGDVGEVKLSLPAATNRYEARIEGDVGAFNIDVAADTRADLDIRSGLGSFTLNLSENSDIEAQIQGDIGNFVVNLPPNAAVRLEAAVDLGSINVPANFEQLRADGDGVNKSGIWQSPNYATAERKINLDFQGDIGGITVR